MASGKSLELAKIKAPKPSKVCICGMAWSDHLRKDGKGVLAKYKDVEQHMPIPSRPFNRKQLRYAVRNRD